MAKIFLIYNKKQNNEKIDKSYLCHNNFNDYFKKQQFRLKSKINYKDFIIFQLIIN